MAVQMTRQEYEQKYGVKPVFASTSVLDDEKPAPIQMTRAEYNALYYPEKQANPDGLGSKLVERGKDILNSGEAERTLTQPLRPELRAVGAVAGAGADVISAVVSPVISAARSFLAEKDITKKVASSKPVGNFLDITNKATDFATGAWKAFEEENPIIAQDIRDIANIASFLPGPKAIKPVVTKADDLIQASKASAAESGIKNVVDEISKIENKYVKTRNANNYEKDVDASRRRIAESNVLADAVDSDGVIRTKGIGGAIDQYKKQTIEGMEDIVKQNLDLNKEVMNFDDVRKALVREVGKSGLEGADLISALTKVDKEIAGLAVRTRGSSIIDLGVLHDAKIATTKNINYLTPPEKATYRKAIARAYKQVVEENSKKFDVKTANETLAKYYKDITRLERLDGARAEGGRLGKMGASIVGTGIGMAAGSTAGGLGAAVGGVIGGEAAQALKGAGMSRTFKGGGKGLAKDPVLVKAKLSIPDKPVKAKSSVPKTKEIKEVESQIAKNVADQKKAIKAGDFTLVAALKEVYVVLVDELKKLIASVKESAKPTNGTNSKLEAFRKGQSSTEGGYVANPFLKKETSKPKGSQDVSSAKNTTAAILEEAKGKTLDVESINRLPIEKADKEDFLRLVEETNTTQKLVGSLINIDNLLGRSIEDLANMGIMNSTARNKVVEIYHILDAVPELRPFVPEQTKQAIKMAGYDPSNVGLDDIVKQANNKVGNSSLLEEAKKFDNGADFYNYSTVQIRDEMQKLGVRGKEQFENWYNANVKTGTKSYAMSHRPTQTGATADNITQEVSDMGFPKDFYDNPQFYAQMSDKASKESLDALMKVRGNPDATVTIYRASPKNEINEGDWVTLSKEYAKRESMAENTPVHSFKVKAKDIQFAGDDINEFGYWPTQTNGKTGSSTLLEEAKKYKSAEELTPGAKLFQNNGSEMEMVGRMNTPKGEMYAFRTKGQPEGSFELFTKDDVSDLLNKQENISASNLEQIKKTESLKESDNQSTEIKKQREETAKQKEVSLMSFLDTLETGDKLNATKSLRRLVSKDGKMMKEFEAIEEFIRDGYTEIKELRQTRGAKKGQLVKSLVSQDGRVYSLDSKGASAYAEYILGL